MPSEAAVRALGLSLLTVLAGGSFVLGSQAPGVVLEPRGLEVILLESSLALTPGNSAMLPVAVVNHGPATVNVTLRLLADGPITSDGAFLPVPPGAERALWLPIEVAADALPRNHSIRVVAVFPSALSGLLAGAATVRILEPGAGIAPGDRVTVHFAALMAGDGRVWDGSLPFANRTSFRRLADFAVRDAPAQWTVGREDFLVGASLRLLGVQEGEARTLVVPPWHAFRNATVVDHFPRTTTVPVELRTAPGVNSTARGDFALWLEQSGQRPVQSWKIGDGVTWRLVTSTGQLVPIRVRLTEIGPHDSSPVRWAFPDAQEPFTIFQAFPLSSRLVERGATEWVIRTTPEYAVGQSFSFTSYWINGTRITSCDPTCDGNYAQANTVTLTHLDDSWRGRSFLYTTAGYPHRYNVTALGTDRIDVFGRNLHPYAGQTILWEVRVLAVSRG